MCVVCISKHRYKSESELGHLRELTVTALSLITVELGVSENSRFWIGRTS